MKPIDYDKFFNRKKNSAALVSSLVPNVVAKASNSASAKFIQVLLTNTNNNKSRITYKETQGQIYDEISIGLEYLSFQHVIYFIEKENDQNQ